MRVLLAAVALVTAMPAGAQQPTAPDQSATALDPAHREAARLFVDRIMPPGAMESMLGGGTFGIGSMEAMLDTRMGDLGAMTNADEATDPELTLGEFMARSDPHFRERMRITSEVSSRVAGEIFVELEPELRDAMVDLYGRRFTLAELEEMNAFFATPTGRKFAEQALTIAQDPAYERIMRSMLPRITAMGQRVLEEVAAATAHLSPAPQLQQEFDVVEEQPPSE